MKVYLSYITEIGLPRSYNMKHWSFHFIEVYSTHSASNFGQQISP
jgi:hypothetical protein